MTQFRLLGPLEAHVPLPGGKPRALLARLLLDSGRALSTDTLIESLWESPPPSAPKVLQAHVSALRKALGADAIETRGGGYVLRAAPSDLARFEELAERARGEGDPELRLGLLQEALGLWRGEPLAEFRREPFARAASARLVEMRLDALMQRIDAELELGRHEQLLPEVTRLVEEEPLREQLRRRLMLALYRAGRQVEALAAYRDGRRLLVEQLGIEPGPELQELERAILRHDPALEDTRGSPARRGIVLCVGLRPLELLRPLGRELLLVELAADAASLSGAAALLADLGDNEPSVRTASFTSTDPVGDVVRLATDQGAELIVTAELLPRLLVDAPCDVAFLAHGEGFAPDGPVLVPFGGGREEWPALELGASLARAHGLELRLLGVEATVERRDATRMLAAASLSLQRFAGIAAAPVIVPPGAEGVLAQHGAMIVASLAGELDQTRRRLLDEAHVPVLLVHGGLRPGALAPEHTLTRFSWTAAPDEPA